ncbi:ABC transporter permease [[Clostridium] symbiosum]|uniref:ABC transporter permease n=1 Tax=Clostridium symbiosum TaxID=1512 RepID=UPI001D086BDE|nr:ABC transporter permease [[Clostridium] symbiosum]MCB6610789.1 ABC transporter permease [[Clostridium] symbiosum]MCB6930956.1 ABC transporter permease [[Clostridium] symbiosum]
MKDFFNRYIHNRLAVIGSAILLIFILLAIFAPLIAPYDPYFMDGTAVLQAPGGAHPLGTDNMGRDILSRVIYGSRISLWVSIVSVSIATVLGLILGVAAGYFGGVLDTLLSRLTDIMFSFPEVLLALLIMSILGASLNNIVIAIGIVYTPIFARIARGAVLSIRGSLYIEASRSIGVPNRTIIFQHIIPNILSPVIVQVTLSLAFAILAEASLSFLGIGVEPDIPSWGVMLSNGKEWLELAWWSAVFPGVFICLAVLGFNILGDGLRDILDPRLRNVQN